METKIIIGVTYLHYKGTEYIPSKIVKDEATGEDWVVYGDKDGNEYGTPAKRWFETVGFDIVRLEPIVRFAHMFGQNIIVERVNMTRDQFIEHAKIIWDNAIEFADNIRYGEFRDTFDETIKSILK